MPEAIHDVHHPEVDTPIDDENFEHATGLAGENDDADAPDAVDLDEAPIDPKPAAAMCRYIRPPGAARIGLTTCAAAAPRTRASACRASIAAEPNRMHADRACTPARSGLDWRRTSPRAHALCAGPPRPRWANLKPPAQ